MTRRTLNVIVCEYCQEPITESDRYPVEDHYMDHLTEDHQDELPNTKVPGGNA